MMASRKKKAPAAEAATSLKQRSLLSFFSNPSSHVLPAKDATPHLQLGEDDDSRSSSLQDAGDSLRWSQLLTGWTPAALGIEPTAKIIIGVDGGKRRRSSSKPLHPSDYDDENEDTKLDLLEASPKCNQATEPQKKTCIFRHDEVFAKDYDEPVVPDYGPSCPGIAFLERAETSIRETNSLAICPPSTPSLKNNSTHPFALEVGPTSILDEECEFSKLSMLVGGPMKTTAIGSVQVKMSTGKENSGTMGDDVGKGCTNLDVVAAIVDNKDRYSLSELRTVNGCKDTAASDMLDEETTNHPPLATESGTTLSFRNLKRGSGHRVSAPEEFLEAPLTDYERERQENILKKQHFMQKLGLARVALASNKQSTSHSGTKPKGKAMVKVKAQMLTVRRSSRLMQESIGLHRQDDAEAAQVVACDASLEEEPLFYDDSSVLKYTCGDRVSINASHHSQELIKDGVNGILGFHPLDGVLQDRCLTRIYTMSACFVPYCQRTLLAAGGHQGHIAVFGTTSLDTTSMENGNLLLSSANDGDLVLWDINKQQKAQQVSKPLALLPPLKVTEARDLHLTGIFSMHEYFGQVATASKDGTVGY
ncbi:hypothetical protein L7F22_036083 [Adiantum nelumboides]|nr:hypothetical protein [Adiantum nelumboides]